MLTSLIFLVRKKLSPKFDIWDQNKDSHPFLRTRQSVNIELLEPRRDGIANNSMSANISDIIGWDGTTHRVIAKGIDGELYAGNPELQSAAGARRIPALAGEGAFLRYGK
jgi:hypothetical protein